MSKSNKNDRVVQSQPINNTEVWDFENHWQKDFSDCCYSGGDCCCAFFCPLCFFGKLFKRTGECCCLFCIPCSLMSLRTKLRTGFRIKGTICRDCIACTCCPLCVGLQIKYELDKQDL